MKAKHLPKLPEGLRWDTSQGPRTYSIRDNFVHLVRFTSKQDYSFGQVVWRGEINPDMWRPNKGDPVPSLEEGVVIMLARWRLGI